MIERCQSRSIIGAGAPRTACAGAWSLTIGERETFRTGDLFLATGAGGAYVTAGSGAMLQ